MPFVPYHQQPGIPTDWRPITHIRLKRGAQPDTPAAKERWKILSRAADDDGTVAIDVVLRILTPMRNLGDPARGIQRDLRCWSNDRNHGNNSQDKGWLELGSKSKDEVSGMT